MSFARAELSRGKTTLQDVVSLHHVSKNAGMKRRLAVILAADVVGYRRLCVDER